MHPYSKGSSLLRDWDITNPCRPPRAPHRRYTIILNSAMNFCLISNMCASVHADFCRPKELESAQTRPSTCSVWNHRTVYEKSSTILSVEKNNLTPIPFALAVLNILNIFTLALIAIMTIDRPRRQCSRLSIRQSPRSVSTTFSVDRRSTGAVTLALIFIMTIDRPCRQCSRSSICQLSWSVSVNPVNN